MCVRVDLCFICTVSAPCTPERGRDKCPILLLLSHLLTDARFAVVLLLSRLFADARLASVLHVLTDLLTDAIYKPIYIACLACA